MRVVIVNKSDTTGGAAVVSHRLMLSLRELGVDASMLVAEKLTDHPDVHLLASASALKKAFLRERLGIFMHNGLNRSDLFKVDTAMTGVPLSTHPLVKEADVVVLGWINQGFISLDEIRCVASLKPVVWVLHDMWCATGVCHHAGECSGFTEQCGNCPLLHGMKGVRDISARTHARKRKLYADTSITFVPVSHWLASRCADSTLLCDADVRVIPNPFPLPEYRFTARYNPERLNLLMVAARIDDHIKGLDTLCCALSVLKETNPQLHSRIHLTLLGNVKDQTSLLPLSVPYEAYGAVPVSMIEPFYRQADILVSPSSYETLPGTLVEAQVYGALPVAFDNGGQRDIVTPSETGILVPRNSDSQQNAIAFAQGIADAAALLETGSRRALANAMYAEVESRFDCHRVAQRYIDLFTELIETRKGAQPKQDSN